MAKATKKSSTPAKVTPNVMVDNNSSVSIREIQNGFLVSESGYSGTGRNQKFYEKQFYSPTNPIAGLGSKMKFGGKK